MSETDFFDPSALQESTQSQKKKKEKPRKEKRPKKEKKKKKDPSSLRFHPVTVRQWLTYFFYFTFLVMCVVSFLSYSRMNQLAHIAATGVQEAKAVAESTLEATQEGDWSRHVGEEFLTHYFTIEEGTSRSDLEQVLSPYLAQGLSMNDLIQFSVGNTRSIQSIQAITQKEKEADETGFTFETTYDVVFVEREQTNQVRVSLLTNIENGEVKVLQPPSFLSMTLSENHEGNTAKATIDPFLSEGESLEEGEAARVVSFIEDFLTLYVQNDPNLKLVSDVAGVGADHVRNIQVLNLVEKEGQLIAETSFQLSFIEGNFFTSTARLTISGEAGSYFVDSVTPF